MSWSVSIWRQVGDNVSRVLDRSNSSSSNIEEPVFSVSLILGGDLEGVGVSGDSLFGPVDVRSGLRGAGESLDSHGSSSVSGNSP